MTNNSIIYTTEQAKKYVIVMPQPLSALSKPLTITREKDLSADDTKIYVKKRSEIVELEKEEVKTLKEQEKMPLLLTDAEQRSFVGKLQEKDVNDLVNSNYFVLINTGSAFKLVPVLNWYTFLGKPGFETLSLEEVEQKIGKKLKDEEKFLAGKAKDDKREDIDFIANFDDDEEEAHDGDVSEKKKLTTTGKELQKLVKTYREDGDEVVDTSSDESVEHIKVKRPSGERKGEKSAKSRESKLNDRVLRNIVSRKKTVTIKDLLGEVKLKYKIDDAAKDILKEFIRNKCILTESEGNTEKILQLKDSKQ